jgi:hypothetical protein
VIAARGEDLLEARLLAERLELADELDLQSRLGGDPFGVLTQLLAQGLGPARKVEPPNLAVIEETRHRPGMAEVGQGGGDHDPVKPRACAARLAWWQRRW